MTALAWWLAKWLRYALLPDEIVSFHLLEFPLVLLAQGVIFCWTGLYKGLWRFASLPDLWNIVRAAVLGALAIMRRCSSTTAWKPCRVRCWWCIRSCSPCCWARRGWLTATGRTAVRICSRRARRSECVIVGADRAGEALVRDLRRDNRYSPVGFLDDKPSLRGASIKGVRCSAASTNCRSWRARRRRRCSSSRCPAPPRRRCAARSLCARAPTCRSARCRGWKTSSPAARSSTR